MDDSATELDRLIHDSLNLTKEFVNEWLAPDDFITAHTSGSTGQPKSIRLLKTDMRHSALATCRFFGITQHDTLYLPLSPDYIAGKMMIVRAFVSGARLIVDKPSNAQCGSRNNRITLAAIVPSQIEGFLQNTPIGNCHYLIVGGGSISPSRHKLLAERTDIKAFSTYGMTEACSHVALCRLSAGAQPNRFKALPGITFSLDNRECLVINAPDYSFKNLVTNDIAELLSPQEFILKGRIDNVINSGGLKLYPEIIEKAIAHLIVNPFYITWRPSEKWEQEAVLVIEADDNDEYKSERLMQQIHTVLPDRECPKEIYFQPKLSRTASGKIIRIHK